MSENKPHQLPHVIPATGPDEVIECEATVMGQTHTAGDPRFYTNRRTTILDELCDMARKYKTQKPRTITQLLEAARALPPGEPLVVTLQEGQLLGKAAFYAMDREDPHHTKYDPNKPFTVWGHPVVCKEGL